MGVYILIMKLFRCATLYNMFMTMYNMFMTITGVQYVYGCLDVLHTYYEMITAVHVVEQFCSEEFGGDFDRGVSRVSW
jgi:hypothetical protein